MDSDWADICAEEEVEDSGATKTVPRSGKVFPKHVVAVLESFYSRGMTGWGEKHSIVIDEAMALTELTIDQLKVNPCTM